MRTEQSLDVQRMTHGQVAVSLAFCLFTWHVDPVQVGLDLRDAAAGRGGGAPRHERPADAGVRHAEGAEDEVGDDEAALGPDDAPRGCDGVSNGRGLIAGALS